MADTSRAALVGACVVLALALPRQVSAGESPPVPTYKSFATPYLLVDTDQVKGLTCYISNVGNQPVSVTGFGLRTRDHAFNPTYNSCPGAGTFMLQPGKACGIGVNLAGEINACTAKVDNTYVVRGSLEARDANQAVVATYRMTAVTANSEVNPIPIASPQMYGAPGQASSFCLFFNTGTQAATLNNVRLITSTGQKVAFNAGNCATSDGNATSSAYVVPPGGTCQYWTFSVPQTDISCRAGTTHRSDVRASLALYRGAATVLNQEPLD